VLADLDRPDGKGDAASLRTASWLGEGNDPLAGGREQAVTRRHLQPNGSWLISNVHAIKPLERWLLL
jgi:hypothetical protein